MFSWYDIFTFRVQGEERVLTGTSASSWPADPVTGASGWRARVRPETALVAEAGCRKHRPRFVRGCGTTARVCLRGWELRLSGCGTRPFCSLAHGLVCEVSGFADQRDRVPRPPGRSYGSYTCVLMGARGWPPPCLETRPGWMCRRARMRLQG